MWPIVHHILVAVLIFGGAVLAAGVGVGAWAAISGARMIRDIEQDQGGVR
jgi:hypothetical protein